MRSLMLLPALAAMCSVQAQQINGYRYWFDDNVAGAVTTSVAVTDELTLVANWPTGPMPPGFHRVSYQVRDSNGDWSVPQTKLFTRGNHALTGYRFWVNDDVATLITASIGPNALVDLNSLIDPGTLTKDYNTVTLQFRDADGAWSVPTTSLFVKNAGLVNGYEYWIDDDIANRTSGSIGPNGVVDLFTDLMTGVPAGDHVFTIRFSGTNGTWSVPLSSAFSSTVGVEELPGITKLLLFPNPADEQVMVAVEAHTAQDLTITVIDAQGRSVTEAIRSNLGTSGIIHVPTSILNAGLYHLRISGAQGSRDLPFVVH